MTLGIFFVLAITVEALIEYGKIIFNKTIDWKQIAAIGIAVFLALAANTDLYAFVGVSFRIPFVGIVLTGIIFSRGSNYLADTIKLFQTSTAANKQIVNFQADYDTIVDKED